jgi:hypothetical protein
MSQISIETSSRPSSGITGFIAELERRLNQARSNCRLDAAADGTHLLALDEEGLGELRSLAREAAARPSGPSVIFSERPAPRLAALDTEAPVAGKPWALIRICKPGAEADTEPWRPRIRPESRAHGLLRRLFLVRYNQPAFFTIMGPEGVGKTTTCGEVEDIFAALPLPLRQFHHTAYWKGDGNADLKEGTGAVSRHREAAAIDTPPAPTLQPRLHYRIARGIWRNLVPDALKAQIVAIPGEIQYVDRITGLLSATSTAGEIALSDRYCYDRYVRWRNLKKPFAQRAMVWLQCRFMRRPRLAILLTDEPGKIHARKPVMPLWELERHHPMLAATCDRFRVRYQVVNIAGRPPAAVASEIARHMIATIGPDIFDLIEIETNEIR